ncbi:hypothetical protein HYU82_00120 [Candidatus Saccharibacteria bacterium]|nr:hypothetical protein [Candidatus Saccharibacteria bacterium]
MTREEFLQAFPERIKNYQPSKQVLERIGNLTLLMTVGPTGVGKTTLMKHLKLPYVPADVTRPKRPEEIEGVDYHFRSDYVRVIEQIKTGEFVQVAIGPGGDFYSTIASSYPEGGTAVIAVVADVVPIFRELGFKKTISTFITPPSYEEWMRRMATHPISEEQRVKRLKEARRSFEFALSDKEVRFILNDDVETAAGQVSKLLAGQIDGQREEKARQIAQSLLATLD